MAKQINDQETKQAWQACHYCPLHTFKCPQEFVRHLRERHCSKEGGSYVCRYGYNGVCPSLPLDGVSDRDYESHVTRHHVNPVSKSAEQWSVYSAAQNLPAVLNDPNRGKQGAFFTKTWGDSFIEKTEIPPSEFLPDITSEHFETYLKKIGRRHRRHSRLANSKLETSQSLKPYLGDVGEFDMREIPSIYLKPDLNFEDVITFNTVFQNICETSQQSNQSGRLLQEKLSHYLDIVEVQIAHQVSQKSSAFFHAMTSHDAMMEQMSQAAQNIRLVRSKIQHIDDTLVKDSLKILSLERSRNNYNSVHDKMKLMATVHQTQPMIQLLLSAPDYVAALDLISTTQEVLSQELAGVHSFRHLPSQLTEMERLIDKMLNTEFERYAAADLNRPLTEDTRVLDADKLISIISGLLRKNNFIFIDTYKEEAITTVKAIVKQMVIEVLASGDAEVCLTGSGEQAPTLSLNEWVVWLETATVTLEKLIHRVKAVHDAMRQVTDSSAGKLTNQNMDDYSEDESFLSHSQHEVVEAKLKDLLVAICDYCHERCGNLVTHQSLDKSTVSASQIVRLSDVISRFTISCESICGKQSAPLRAAFKTQALKYVQKFHNEKRNKLSLLQDSEQWKQAEVPAEFQTLVNSIASSSGFINVVRDLEIERPPPASALIVDGEPYAVVGTALLLVQIVSEYCRCASQLTLMSTQISRNLVDLLRTFNSRCCQLVLGAGALHVAGLKTITSSNLALVSRALQLVLWLLPHVKHHFRSLESNGSLPDFAGYVAVEKDLISHVQEIGNKVLSIVGALVSSQLLNWDARPPVPSQPFRNISRHFVKLHEAVSPIFPELQIHALYRTIHKNFKDKLREQVLKNNIINNGGPQHGVVTSELMFYLETLRTLKALPNSEITDQSMDDIWIKP